MTGPPIDKLQNNSVIGPAEASLAPVVKLYSTVKRTIAAPSFKIDSPSIKIERFFGAPRS